MDSGYFVVQKFFEFYFRHRVVLKLRPTRGFVKVFVQKVNSLSVFIYFLELISITSLPVPSEPMLSYSR